MLKDKMKLCTEEYKNYKYEEDNTHNSNFSFGDGELPSSEECVGRKFNPDEIK